MLKYVSKFAMDILPSVVATIIGAYIVNHYIATKPGADAPVAAAVSSADPVKAGVRSHAKPADVGNLPQPGITAKGISERAMLEKTAAERPAVVEKSTEKPAEKTADRSAETASIPAETHRPPAQREKTVAKSAPAQPAAVAAVPVIAAPNTTQPVEAAAPAEDHRDANELARAAIERLRGGGEGSSGTQEASRIPNPAHVPDSPRAVSAPAVIAATPVRPLPPPIMVSTPATETFNSAPGSSRMAYPDEYGDRRRPTPPADIPDALPSPVPSSGPLDLRADAGEPARRPHTTVAEDMLLAAKSVFHAVLPKQLEPRPD